MNINNLLQVLTEDRNIEHVNSSIKDRVPASVINALSSKMKKGKYDNEAMAIFQIIQDWKADENSPARKENSSKRIEPNLEYLYKHAGLVYSVLKKLKRGKSDWSPSEVLSDFIITRETPQTFWKNKYTEANADKPVLSKKGKEYNTTGLGTARVKELSDSFAIFPKNYKLENGVFQEMDIPKSQEDIRKISAEIAAKDTTEKVGSKVNHWCVAAENKSYFNDYKKNTGDKGIFIIIVEKNKDGSPDWNNRYLVFFTPSKGKKNSEKDIRYNNNYSRSFELADKWDYHLRLEHLPQGAQKFILKVAENNKNKPDINKEINSRISKAQLSDERSVELDEKATEYDRLYNDAIDFFKEEERKGKVNQAKSLRTFLKRNLNQQKSYNSYKEWGDKTIDIEYLCFPIKMAGDYATIKEIGNGLWRFRLNNNFQFTAGSREEIFNTLDKCLTDNNMIDNIVEKNLAKSYNTQKLGRINNVRPGAPGKEMMNVLKGNKSLLKVYNSRLVDKEGYRYNWNFIIPFSNSQKETNYMLVEMYYVNRNSFNIPHYSFRAKSHGWQSKEGSGELYNRDDLENMKKEFLSLKAQWENAL